ncbi:MAG: UDP-N-acetylglucosamine 2-epimerase (non-hydrolyzing) [Desulfobulbaceae bacterium A2]|nr:MAG: UDP-N-acetylglucosamine 2-epimerase (non-hydrolyzing) [Desulfobulbaceae bacterium A2]
MRVVSIVGARPQFVKAAMVSRSVRRYCREILVHTGQHYDAGMSAIFFQELDIPPPDFYLEVGSGAHGFQTGRMLEKIEEVLLVTKPDWVLVYGDTNSTLAGALAAVKLHIPVVHIEAGLRSFNRQMPEEINRVLTDHISNLLFCPSDTAEANLRDEGITVGVNVVGDVMADVLVMALEKAAPRERRRKQFGVQSGCYLLVTVHRAENTDDTDRLRAILAVLNSISEDIIFPVHPRTAKRIADMEFIPGPHLQLVPPVGYLDMVSLVEGARQVLTDSGGAQKEAYWLGVPCVTLRDETEWVETVETGWNRLVGANAGLIDEAVRFFVPPRDRPLLYGGDGHAADRCAAILLAADTKTRA